MVEDNCCIGRVKDEGCLVRVCLYWYGCEVMLGVRLFMPHSNIENSRMNSTQIFDLRQKRGYANPILNWIPNDDDIDDCSTFTASFIVHALHQQHIVF